MEIKKDILLASYFDEDLENLIKVLKIPSELKHSKPGNLFKARIQKALQNTIDIAKQWKVKTYINPRWFLWIFWIWGRGS